jgi:hypothetical protein
MQYSFNYGQAIESVPADILITYLIDAMSQPDYPVTDLPTPDPGYGPEQAVGIQLEALADNDDPVENAGIKTAYSFTSPANRRRPVRQDGRRTSVRADDRSR